MSQAAPILREIKSLFNNQGINNDVQIASHLGFLLLVSDHWAEIRQTAQFDFERLFTELRRSLEERVHTTFAIRSNLPQSPAQQLRGNNLYEIPRITDKLTEAMHASPWHDVGDFFQHEIRFEILKDVRRESYPTPHHIADFIAALGVNHSESPIKVFDPAAGTGGLLAAALRYAPNAELIGCDFDPNIAEVGVANLLLHRPPAGIEFYQESSLAIIGQWQAPIFDSVIINPPFGGTRSAAEVEQLTRYFLDANYGRSVHTLLAAVAMQMLKRGGQAAFLLPTGSLFGSGGEERLRAALLHRHHLEAIITLNKELFQPYSGVAAHLVVAQKGQSPANSIDAVWFGDIISDGYLTGAGRNLTAHQDPATNELPRMRDLVLRTRTATWDQTLTLTEGTHLHLLLLRSRDGLPGVGVIAKGATAIHWQMRTLPSGVLMTGERRDEPGSDNATLLTHLYLPYQANSPIILPPEQVAEITWTTAISASWSPTLKGATRVIWQGDTDAITAQLEATSALTVKSGTSRSNLYRFQTTDKLDTGVIACFISDEGQPITPWLVLRDDQLIQSLQAADFAKKFSALPLFDALQVQCGWVVQLSAQNEAEQTTAIPDGVLLILFSATATLHHAMTLNEYIALLPSGWARLTAQGFVHVEVGKSLTLRNGVTAVGFGVGPMPPGSTEAHRLFAVAIPKSSLTTTDGVGNFEPRHFLPEPPTAAVGHPSEIIANIRKSQARLGLQVDMLLNLLGSTAQKEQATADSLTGHPLTHLLATKQQQFWQQLQEQAAANPKPFYFTADDLLSRFHTPDYSEDFIRQQLDLFIRMGLLEAVHIGERNLYRLSVMARGTAAS